MGVVIGAIAVPKQCSSAAEPSLEEDQPPDVVGEVGEADLHFRPHDPDGSDAERHRPLLVREDMLDAGADSQAAGGCGQGRRAG